MRIQTKPRSNKTEFTAADLIRPHHISKQFGPPVQLFANEEDEEIQAKVDSGKAIQQQEEEELQMKASPAQMKEEEELMQGKAIQKAPEEEEVQMKESSADSTQSAASASSTQSTLPRDVNARMEASFNTNFSNVNIHTNDSKAAQMKALAFTQGNNVHFAPGQYNPHTSKGQELIGHEYTHVVQQGSGQVAPTTQAKGMPINDNPALENEADVMGKRAAEGKSADVSGVGSGVQRKGEDGKKVEQKKPEMEQEQIQKAINNNNSLNLSALSISYLQEAMCVPITGVFDKETIVAIGQVSIQNRIVPIRSDYANASLRDSYLQRQESSLTKKDKKTIEKHEQKTNKIESKRNENNSIKTNEKLDDRYRIINEIKAPYLTPEEHRHIIETEGLGSTVDIDTQINNVESHFEACDGQLGTSIFSTIYNNIVLNGSYAQALDLSMDFSGFTVDSRTIAIQYDPSLKHLYLVKVPFSQLSINSESKQSFISNAPNTLKNIFIGKNAFSSYYSLLACIESANSITVEQNVANNEVSEEENIAELSDAVIAKSITNNSSIFSDNKSCNLIQAITGSPITGQFDDNTIRRISNFQNINVIGRTDGMLDKATINLIINSLKDAGLQVSALDLMRDFYSLDENSDDQIIMNYSSEIENSHKKAASLRGVDQTQFGEEAFANNGADLGQIMKEAYGADKTQTPTLLPNSYRIYSDNSGIIKIWICDNNGDGKEYELDKNLTYLRDEYILKKYNWNAIVGIMKFISSKLPGYKYNIPTNLGGTADDNDLIVPDKGILGIVELQLINAINTQSGIITNENIETIVSSAHGKPNSSFAVMMGEDSQNDLRNEGDNSNMEKQDGEEIDIPDFGTLGESDLYDTLKDLTLARNGLWSEENKIRNIISVRRRLDNNITKYNDTTVVCWVENEEEQDIKNAKIYSSTTEPGEINNHRKLEPQTLTVNLGYHSGKQPAGRTSQALIRDKANSNTLNFDSDDTTFNLHHGGNEQVNISGLSSNSLSTDYISTESIEVSVNLLYIKAFRLLTQWGQKQDIEAFDYLEEWKNAQKFELSDIENNLATINNTVNENTYTRNVEDIKAYIVNNYSDDEESKNNLIQIIHSVEPDFVIPENFYELNNSELKNLIQDSHIEGIFRVQTDYIKEIDNIDGKPGDSYFKMINGEMESFDETHSKAITDYTSLEATFNNLKLILGNDIGQTKIDYLKSLKPGTINERNKYVGENNIVGQNPDASESITQDVGAWSEGCQVIFGPEKFYEFWNHVSEDVTETGQRRWYYTIIDAESMQTNTEEGTE